MPLRQHGLCPLARTLVLQIVRSLGAKFSHRGGQMSDIAERLRASAAGAQESGFIDAANLEREAADEIERLRAALDRAADALEFYDNKAEAQKARRALEGKE